MKVKKASGKRQAFDKNKLTASITAASNASDESMPKYMVSRIADRIEKALEEKNVAVISSSEIARMVEDELMGTSYRDVARSYVTYHHDQEQARWHSNPIYINARKKLSGKSNERSNANCDELSFSGRVNEATRILVKEIALDGMSKTSRDNHNNNLIYIHDLDNYEVGTHNCLSIPFDRLFSLNQVVLKQTELRGPRSINTAMQLVAVYMQIQSLQNFGGVAATHIDWTMVPYVRYSFYKNMRKVKEARGVEWKIPKNCSEIPIEKYKNDDCYEIALRWTENETLQGAEGLIHNLNSLQSRSGQQLEWWLAA